MSTGSLLLRLRDLRHWATEKMTIAQKIKARSRAKGPLVTPEPIATNKALFSPSISRSVHVKYEARGPREER